MIAAPVKTNGGGGALLPAVVGFCVPVRRDSIEGRRLRRTRARCRRNTPPAARGDGAAVLEDLPGTACVSPSVRRRPRNRV